jgi:hypothetical protein
MSISKYQALVRSRAVRTVVFTVVGQLIATNMSRFRETVVNASLVRLRNMLAYYLGM